MCKNWYKEISENKLEKKKLFGLEVKKFNF